MSIGKRLADLVRSNVGALWERGSDGFSGGRGGARIEELSDRELEEELRKRRLRREAAERAAEASKEAASGSDSSRSAWDEVEEALGSEGGRYRTAGSYRASNFARQPSGVWGPGQVPRRDPRLARLYAQLECPYGADLETIRKCYRAMMRKYHPDMHSRNPERQRVATELSQKLTQAYNELKRHQQTRAAP